MVRPYMAACYKWKIKGLCKGREEAGGTSCKIVKVVEYIICNDFDPEATLTDVPVTESMIKCSLPPRIYM